MFSCEFCEVSKNTFFTENLWRLLLNEKEILVTSFVYANFNYCFLICYFYSAKSVRKIEQIQTMVVRNLYNDFDSDYKTLLDKSDKCTMKVKCLRTLALEIFKTLIELNQECKSCFRGRNIS